MGGIGRTRRRDVGWKLDGTEHGNEALRYECRGGNTTRMRAQRTKTARGAGTCGLSTSDLGAVVVANIGDIVHRGATMRGRE